MSDNKIKKKKTKRKFNKNPEVGRGFDSALPAAKDAEFTRRKSPLGKFSPRAAILSGVSKIIDAFSDDETATGRRHARNVAKKMKNVDIANPPRKPSKKRGGGTVGRGMGVALKGGGSVTRS